LSRYFEISVEEGEEVKAFGLMLGDGFTYISLLMLKFVMSMNVMFCVERLVKLLRSANAARSLDGRSWEDSWGKESE
jgi:hypothetical protein